MNDLRDEAVVLRGYRSGEADRIVALFTREHGKVRAIAKGVRKQTTKIGGGLEPLAHVRLFLAVGRSSLAIVRQVEHVRQYPVLKANFERITAAMAVLEATDAIPAEDVSDPEIFELLTRALATLDDPQYAPTLVPAAYFLRLLVHDGSAPVLNECAHCGRNGPLVAFDAAVGGALCANCRSGRSISPPALALLRQLLGGQLAAVLRAVDPDGGAEVTALAGEAIEHHYGRRLKVLRATPTVS